MQYERYNWGVGDRFFDYVFCGKLHGRRLHVIEPDQSTRRKMDILLQELL